MANRKINNGHRRDRERSPNIANKAGE